MDYLEIKIEARVDDSLRLQTLLCSGLEALIVGRAVRMVVTIVVQIGAWVVLWVMVAAEGLRGIRWLPAFSELSVVVIGY